MRNPILLNKLALVGVAAFFGAYLPTTEPAFEFVFMPVFARALEIERGFPVRPESGARVHNGTANRNVSADEKTREATALFASNKVQEAIELENQVVKNAPGYWLPHSALSIMEWRRNRYDIALKEAQAAAKLAPENETAVLNYAQMSQQLGYYETSIPLFRKAIKVSSSNWAPRIGLMQCLVSSARADEARAVLDQMSGKTDADFDWWYQLANSYSKLDKPKQAAAAAQKALAVASSAEQKASAIASLFIDLIRANEIDRARAIEDDVFKGKPKDDEVYVRAAADLYPVTDPVRGRNLISAAIDNCLPNTEGYYRIGEVFEQKADTHSGDLNYRDAWLDNAEVAYRAAIKGSPTNAKYYLALAAIFDRMGRTEEMVAMLTKAKVLDSSDALAPYLVSRVKLANNDLAGRLREKLTGAAEKPYQLNLAKTDFQVDNLHCNCRLTALQVQIKQQIGIKFVAITNREKPFKGTLLVDQSFGTTKAFETIEKREAVRLEVVSSEPVHTVSEAIKISQNLRDLGQLSKTWSFVPDSPKMPVI